MLDQVKFMETLRAVAEVARVSVTPLSKEEINEYFEGMELTEEQQELVFQYLLNPEPEEPVQSEEPEASESVEEEGKEVEQKDSMFLKMYKEEIQNVPCLSIAQEREAYMKLIDGDASVTQSISDHWLSKVIDLAQTYEKHNVNIEDIIQEGNIGLLMGIQNLLGTHKMIDVEEYLKESIQKAMEDYIDEMSTEDDWESTVLAKTTLIHEAKAMMTEQNGKEPTNQELSDFTKIPLEEIQDILHLSLEDEQSKENGSNEGANKDASIEPWFNQSEEQ